MALPKQVSRKLREMLGNEPADTMIDWLDQRERRHQRLRRRSRSDIDVLRHETRAEFAKVRQEIAELRAAMDVRFAQLETRMGELKSDLLKWAIGFWVASLLGIVGALVTLSRISH